MAGTPVALRATNVKVAILELFLEDPKAEWYGYELRKHLKERLGRVVSTGSVYPALMTLKDNGILQETRVEGSGDRGRPPRYLYRLVRPHGEALARQLVERTVSRGIAGRGVLI